MQITTTFRYSNAHLCWALLDCEAKDLIRINNHDTLIRAKVFCDSSTNKKTTTTSL